MRHARRGMAARAPPRRAPTASPADARGALVLRRAATPPRAPARPSSPRAAPAPASASRSRCQPGLEFAQALHACLLLGAVAVPVDLRLSARERARDRRRRCALARRGAAERRSGPRPGGRSPGVAPRHDLDATAVVIHTSGTTAAPQPIELTYGNLLWSALGSAVALGPRPRRALAVRAAAVARRRPLDPACARRSTRRRPSCTSASRPSACCTRCASRT